MQPAPPPTLSGAAPAVTLLELSSTDTLAIGVRILSSVAKTQGFSPRLIFMRGDNSFPDRGSGGPLLYPPKVVEQVLDLAQGSALVGVSFLTNYFHRAVQLTQAISGRLGIPVVWGGVHATAKPMEALQYADMVALGEGENTFAELLGCLRLDRPHHQLAGLWVKQDGRALENPMRPLEQDLDRLPWQDYDFQDHYYLSETQGRILPYARQDFPRLAANSISQYGGSMVSAMMTRGCTASCSYCYNSYWRELYKGQRYLRSRSPQSMVAELVQLKRELPQLKAVLFSDDNFFAKKTEQINSFADLYQREVGLPFLAQVTPMGVDAVRVETLAQAGMVQVSMGVESASPSTAELFNRLRFKDSAIVEAAHILHQSYLKHRERGMRPPAYDFILDSPWESEEDAFFNLSLLLRFPQPLQLHLASLVFYPGTRIQQKAKDDGLLTDEESQVYLRPFMDSRLSVFRHTLANLLMVYFDLLPASLLRRALDPQRRQRWQRWLTPARIAWLIGQRRRVNQAAKLLRAIAGGDFSRLAFWAKKALRRPPAA